MLKLGSYQEPVPRALEILSGIFFCQALEFPIFIFMVCKIQGEQEKGK